MALSASVTTTLDIRFDLASAPPGVNPYSARGLRGTLSPIDMARGLDKLARTVNGALVDISAPQMRKYKLEVTGSDQAPPALDGLWVGTIVTVDCHVELGYRTGSTPTRSAVPGSARTEGNYSYYRPRLVCRVVEYQAEVEEWAASVPWTLSLEEV